ncbi:HNH endonuclease [Streptomyces phage Targaryen]|nr:HNH endonuclease [Streptomyces phage Targaryen]
MKCIRCTLDKPEEDFPARTEKYRTGKRRTTCKLCVAEQQRERYVRYKLNSYFKYKVKRAKVRANDCGVPFDLTPEYLESIWTGVCPILGVDLDREADRLDEKAPELDRFIPEKGYTQGNVAFISRRANRFKSDATVGEIERVLEWMKKVDQN